jgi:hypothetical protein
MVTMGGIYKQIIGRWKKLHLLNKKSDIRLNDEQRRGVISAIKNRWETTGILEHEMLRKKESRNRVSKLMKNKWKDGAWKDKQIRKMKSGLNVKPNRLEKKMIDIINKYNLPFKYVGNWQFILGGRCPDFLNCNGEKKVIEVFGTYWHSPIHNPKVKTPYTYQETMKHYGKYGFKCIILWEHELINLPEQRIVEKIKLM